MSKTVSCVEIKLRLFESLFPNLLILLMSTQQPLLRKWPRMIYTTEAKGDLYKSKS